MALIPGVTILYIIDMEDLVKADFLVGIGWLWGVIGAVGLLGATLISTYEKGGTPNKIKLTIICLLLCGSLGVYTNFNGGFWGGKILSAEFLDDRSAMRLRLFQNGKYILVSDWMFGDTRSEGNYHMEADTIYFEGYPLPDSDFVPQKILIQKDKIYFGLLPDGQYEKSFYYFREK